MKATPMTPWATARMVAVDSLVNLGPRSGPTMRAKIGLGCARAGLAEGHDDAGDDERREEHQDAAADAGHEAERRLGEVADLRLQALHQRRQVGVRPRPDRVDLLADDRPFGDARSRRRNLQRVVSARRGSAAAPSRRANSSARRWARRSAATPSSAISVAASPCRPPIVAPALVQRIQGDGQDQRPDHQGQEGREDPVAQQRQRQDQRRRGSGRRAAATRSSARERLQVSGERSSLILLGPP